MTTAEASTTSTSCCAIFGSAESRERSGSRPGSRPRIIGAGGTSQDVSGRVLSRQEILAIVGPIVPEHARRQLPKEPSVSFDYALPRLGPFKLTMARDSERLIVTIVSEQPGRRTGAGRASRPQRRQPAAAGAGPRRRRACAASADRGRRASDRSAVPGHGRGRRLGPPPHRRDAAAHSQGRPHAAARSRAARRSIRQPSRTLLQPIMPEKNASEFAARHDTDFAYEIPGLARFRANVFVDRKGPGAVFRVIPSKILTAEQLGLSPHILQLCQLTKGLVLVTGPTGSGKSTTLCAMVDYINRNRDDHIITIEDPIEFVHENQKCLINQREVGTHTDSFKGALRAALREDPDIVLVGEMRDLETVAIAIETAETGHLVFGTLHTTTAASTVDRIIDQFPADRQAQIRVMLSESLRGVISQTLCRKIGGGRVAALEVLIVTSAVSNLIREGKTFQIPSMMQVGKARRHGQPQRRADGPGDAEARHAGGGLREERRQDELRGSAEARGHRHQVRARGPA